MMEYLTRPGFNGGGAVSNRTVLPKRKPAAEVKKRNSLMKRNHQPRIRRQSKKKKLRIESSLWTLGEEEEEELLEYETAIGCRTTLTTSTLKIENACFSSEDATAYTNYVYPMFYSYVIFTAENFLGGQSL